jgi:hypothetical protein
MVMAPLQSGNAPPCDRTAAVSVSVVVVMA